MEYAREYQLYFYSAEKGFANIKTSRASFLLKFDKAVQKTNQKTSPEKQNQN